MRLSLIIPCYNVAAIVERTLLTLTNQSINDLEIICIDDRSTDNTLEILKRIAKNDLRVRVFQNDDPMGMGYTCNRGIDLASGDFVAFVEPGDLVESDFYYKLIRTAQKNDLPVVCGDVVVHDFVGKKHKTECDKIDKNYHYFYRYYAAVYYRDYLNRFNISFAKSSVLSDAPFVAMAKLYMPAPIKRVRGTCYHRCHNIQSADTTYVPMEKIDEMMDAFARVIDVYNMVPANRITPDDYAIGVDFALNRVISQISTTHDACAKKIATRLCEIFPKILFVHTIMFDQYPMAQAINNGDIESVVEIAKSSRWFYRTYKLPIINRPIATMKYNSRKKIIRLFGIKIWEINTDACL